MNIDYSKIENEMEIDMDFILDSGLRIGGTGPDRERILRVANTPLISNASIKGVLRSEFQRLENLKWGADWQGEKFHIAGHEPAFLKWSDVLFGVTDLSDSDEASYSVKGCVQVSDIILHNSTSETRPHAKIKAATRTVDNYYSLESVVPNISAALNIRITNLTVREPLLLFALIIEEIGSGNIGIGAQTNTGLGRLASLAYRVRFYSSPAQILGLMEPKAASGDSLVDCINSCIADL